MTPDLPKRDENHSRSSWSDRAFAHVLPPEWVVHPVEEDYGIDRRVEIFEHEQTTGIFFNVQLKSTRQGSGHQPAESIKRSTLNYWAQTPDATLVVIAHEPSKTLWFCWSHLLPHDENPETKSRQVRCKEMLDSESASLLAEEARAWRFARELWRHLPIDVHLKGDDLHGAVGRPLRRAIARKLAALPAFVRVVHNAPALPYLYASIDGDRIVAGLRGNYEHPITWDPQIQDYSELAPDVIASFAVSCASVGAEELCLRLLRIAAPGSHAIFNASSFGYVIGLLTKFGESETLLTFIRRAATSGNPRPHDVAITAVLSSHPEPELLRAVAHVVRDAAGSSEHPAVRLYNAGNMLRTVDPAESLRLYEEAATADVAYRKRGYWWREKGNANWAMEKISDAESCYRHAVRLGDWKACAYLADLLMRTGRYEEARDVLADAPIWDDPRDAQWRLTSYALRLIVDELGIAKQRREDLAIPSFQPSLDEEGSQSLEVAALEAIRADAMNGWAFAGLATAWEGNEDRDSLLARATAAVVVNTAGSLWASLLFATLADGSHEDGVLGHIAQDAMWCAWANFGDTFVDELLDDPMMTDSLRQMTLEFFETLRLPAHPIELRDHDDSGSYKSVFLPTDPRAGL
ncbi:DUF4365 domain-containing protein [Microbacterium sp. JZ37]|uniref:DUF4365 domain-containing protein n=1 Tax=Microbacterium sp. JZ37 TaxID=2654193 RepID=UPI002B46098D|nr:DUF4365 domain-containing protein [Microbacterium sp. JZ37]WRH16184.1 DUF4365 domain-containing protein [Microbacterium sp. JZ37]